MTEVNKLAELLSSVAGRMENGAGELTKDMLLEVVDKLKVLENVATAAAYLVKPIPRNGKGSIESKVNRAVVNDLIAALNNAGRYGRDGTHIKEVK
jgi:hypothetical protein